MKHITPVVLASLACVTAAYAQSSAFTYQGELKDGFVTANGVFDLRFRLFDAASGGAQIGATVCVDNVQVTNGVFTTSLDFGQQFASISSRHLEIAVRRDTGLNCANSTGFTPMAPRQTLSPSPRAIAAGVANALSAPDGAPANAVFVDNLGKVGVGTTSPTHWLHIAQLVPTLALQDTNAASQQAGYISYRDNGNVERAWVGYGTQGSPDFSVVNARPSGKVVLQAFGAGSSVIVPSNSLGVGTTTPGVYAAGTKLDVIGGSILVNNNGDQADLLWLASERSWVFRQQGAGAAAGLKLQSIGGGGNKNFLIDTTGFVGIGTLNPQAKLDVAGTARVQVLEITGADLAEKFPASEPLEPGMVVAIDRERAGKLCMSRGAYNRCVAGVVSGANNFSVGAVLGNLPGHEDAPAIALSGRVYVRCDASSDAIEPGDLLTTSDLPGYAMKASDHDRSHGAIIGKAMEPLATGKQGLVLVLVNLQ